MTSEEEKRCGSSSFRNMEFNFLYSDPHFSHSNILKYCNRPFKDVEEMQEQFISNYNKKVYGDSTVLWLGDCFFHHKAAETVLGKLKGEKWLLRGNHDKRITDTQFIKAGFNVVFSTHFIYYLDRDLPVRFSHYPYESYSEDRRYRERRPPREQGVILIHGHTHEKCKITPNKTIHVGVDAWDYSPAPIEEVCLLARRIKNEKR